MTLLSIVQSVCDEVGLPRPAAVATNPDQLARQMFSLANKELRELSKLYNWPVLVREYEVPVVVGVASYALPDDYKSIIGETAYASGQFWGARGSLSPQEWQYRRRELLNSLDQIGFRIYGDPQRMVFDPAPSVGNAPVFEYNSSSFAKSEDGTRKPQYMVDSDTALIDEDLVQMGLMWRIKHAKGLEFTADRAEYDMAVPRAFSKALALPNIQIGGAIWDSPLTEGYVRSTGFGS